MSRQQHLLAELGKWSAFYVYSDIDQLKAQCKTSMDLKDVNGLYWIFTTHKVADLKTLPAPHSAKHVHISRLCKLHDGLPLIHSEDQQTDGWWCVYSGKGKNLFRRIGQHFGTNPSGGTGALSLGQYEPPFSDTSHWAVSVLVLSSTEVTFGSSLDYFTHAGTMERLWRLNYGWPILCRQ